ncbi:mCG145721, isoform CRA_b [Mus musculus]|nr:mCG145721, isoform CRA_b [Mus musculus]
MSTSLNVKDCNIKLEILNRTEKFQKEYLKLTTEHKTSRQLLCGILKLCLINYEQSHTDK